MGSGGRKERAEALSWDRVVAALQERADLCASPRAAFAFLAGGPEESLSAAWRLQAS